MHSIERLVLILPLFACASLDKTIVPECVAVEALPALPDTSCLEDPDTAEFRHRLRITLGPDAGPLVVRALLDDASHVQSVCAGSTLVPGGWRSRSNLAKRYAQLIEIDGGPACLANRRLDLNRKAARLALIKRRRSECTGELGTMNQTGLHGQESSTVTGERQSCLDQGADWILLNRKGLKRPLIFAKPAVSDPPDINAHRTRRKCFKLGDYDARVTCIMEDGWELLE